MLDRPDLPVKPPVEAVLMLQPAGGGDPLGAELSRRARQAARAADVVETGKTGSCFENETNRKTKTTQRTHGKNPSFQPWLSDGENLDETTVNLDVFVETTGGRQKEPTLPK